MPTTIERLEKINELIDLCIDGELYQELSELPGLLVLNDGVIIPSLPKDMKNALSSQLSFPVISVKHPTDLETTVISLSEEQEGIGEVLRKAWSHLFWAKRLRALILEKNQADWNRTYDSLILYLEKHLPEQNEEESAIYNKTLFNCLMELSALDTGAASYGYADRARKILDKIYPEKKASARLFYDRWIWWNKGVALQHIGDRIQKAVLQFNQVIITFFRDTKIDRIVENGSAEQIEYLLNIWPAVILRASLQLKLQLGYHALITLKSPKYHREVLDKIGEGDGHELFKKAANHLIIKTNLMEMEAHLQLENLSDAQEIYKKIIEKLPTDERKYPIDINSTALKLPEAIEIDKRKAYHTQLIEQIVAYQLQKSKKEKFAELSIDGLIGNIKDEFRIYWDWVKNNTLDIPVYLTRHAQFLKGVAYKVTKSSEVKALLDTIYEFYQDFYSRLSNGKNEEDRYEFNNYKLDDLPDIQEGFKDFCKNINSLYDNEKSNVIKQNYWDFLAALDKHEKEFGENLRIASLKRCNDRLIFPEQTGKDSCEWCLKECNQEPFQNLLKCCPISVTESRYELSNEDYEFLMSSSEEHLTQHLNIRSMHTPIGKALHFHGLQRWNSLTPAQGRSIGGGYFLYRTTDNGITDLGIAIDPGFDYVRNLFKMGFSLKDIDIVLISHAHADHLWDFESIIQLLHERYEKLNELHRISVILTLASYRNLEHVIRRSKLKRYVNTLVIDIEKEVDPDGDIKFEFENAKQNDPGHHTHWQPIVCTEKRDCNGNTNDSDHLTIRCTRAYHDDFSDRSDSYGFIIELPGPSKEQDTIKFGYTGDTKWVGNDLYREGCFLYDNIKNICSAKKEQDQKCSIIFSDSIASQYEGCDLLLLHLGSLIDHKNNITFKDYSKPEQCIELIRKKNHPYLMGMIRFLNAIFCKPENGEKVGSKLSLILLSEFGEELRGGIRTDIVERLRESITNKKPVLPVDVGLDILLWEAVDEQTSEPADVRAGKAKFLCSLCDKYRPIENIDTIRYGQDEAIFHVCTTCKKALPHDVQQNILRQLYEIGRELKTVPDPKKSNAN